MKLTLGWLSALVLVAAPGARADLQLSLDSNTLTGFHGEWLTFTGTLTNQTADPNGTLFLNGADFPSLDVGLIGDATPFLNNAPLFLTPGETLPASIGLFAVQVTGLPGATYQGDFEITGGPDDQTYSSLASAAFTVNVSAVPEPGALASLGAGAFVAAGLYRRRRR